MKIKNKNSIWVSFMHMKSPRLFRGYKGEYTNRKYFPNFSVLHFWINQRIYNFLAKKADIVVATNPCYKKLLIKKFSKVGIIHYGIDLPIKQKNGEQTINLKKKIYDYDAVFIGRFHPQKGIFELLDIWEKVIKKDNRLKLAVVGSYLDSDNKELVRKIYENGLENNVDLLGYRGGVEKEKVLKSSRIFLFPSLYESFGIVALEAMSHGLPVIAYNLPVFEIFAENMMKVPVLDNEKFVEAFFKLLNDDLCYKRISEKVEEYSKGFTWHKTGEQFECIIKDYLDSVL